MLPEEVLQVGLIRNAFRVPLFFRCVDPCTLLRVTLDPPVTSEPPVAWVGLGVPLLRPLLAVPAGLLTLLYWPRMHKTIYMRLGSVYTRLGSERV